MSPKPESEDRIAVFRNMLESDPENELANFTLGKLYLDSGDLESSEKLLRKTLELNAMHSMSYRLLGQLLLDSDRRDEGVALLEKGVALAPSPSGSTRISAMFCTSRISCGPRRTSRRGL